ncbi:RNase H domain-containing protein [Trichonephila clavipes]|nr:RNase H domain-containing protein [Trichonephila clavipes]
MFIHNRRGSDEIACLSPDFSDSSSKIVAVAALFKDLNLKISCDNPSTKLSGRVVAYHASVSQIRGSNPRLVIVDSALQHRSSIQHLSNWTSIGDSTSRSILHLFQQLSDRHPYHLQWVPSHVGLPGNEVAEDLAKAATSNPVDPEDHMVLTSTEIYSMAIELIRRTWVVPPVYPWYFQRHPGSTIPFKGSRSYQTAFS